MTRNLPAKITKGRVYGATRLNQTGRRGRFRKRAGGDVQELARVALIARVVKFSAHHVSH